MNVGGRSGRGGVLPVLVAVLCLVAAAMPTPAAADQAEALYRPDRVDVIELALPPEAIADLEAEPDEYVKGTFALAATDGTPAGVGPFTAPRNVEVRLKGDASFHDLGGKAAFKLKFKSADAFLGLRKMTLNNMVEDPSMTHETLAYTAFRAAGVAAPRTSFAYVYANGVDYGLHLDVETLDKVALQERFGPFQEPPQHLYEGEAGDDVRPGGAAGFEVDEGDDGDLSDLEALIAATNGTGVEPWWTRIAPFADLMQMTRMWAVEKYVGELDGYSSGRDPFQPNNYYLFSDATGRFKMLPWGADETFQSRNRLAFDEAHGLLFARCLADSTCASTYLSAVTETCSAIDPVGLDALAARTATLLAPWQALEQGNGPRHEYDPAEIADGVDETREFVGSRPTDVADFIGGPCGGSTPSTPPPTGSAPLSGTPPVAADPTVANLKVGRAQPDGNRVVTQVALPGPGTVSLRGMIATADGPVAACKGSQEVKRARDLSVACRFTEAFRARLRSRWLGIDLVLAFTPTTGPTETSRQRVVVKRIAS